MNKYNFSSHVKMCSKSIRSSFLDYFSNVHGHTLVKSSPVVPFNDGSIAFVNSGMCQFKNVFLGLSPAVAPRVANSQKCIRVGGKHNDLSCAGRDGFHHTFFEMLGNWSFNDYYKRDACHMALEFLTKPPVSLPLGRLYFTYFGGNEQYNLPCDEETQNIWLELGVPDHQIKKESMLSNFWEMGNTGPCGYSSEIHFDMKGDPQSALSRINGNTNDLIEIWNIVFISYNRVSPESFIPLSYNFVDTGLGFERLVTLLQEKTSTYDTDLFGPLLKTISKESGFKPYGGSFTAPNITDLDTSYRILSDYSRMITVALADNMFPDTSAKLRNVVRDALLISEDTFKVKDAKLLKELTYCIAEVLGESYPEIQDNINKIQLIISEESRIFNNLRKDAVKEWATLVKSEPNLEKLNIMEEPSLVAGVKYLNKQQAREPSLSEISGEMAFALYDTYGLSKDVITKLAVTKKLTVDHAGFEVKLKELKAASKDMSETKLPQLDPHDLKDFPMTNDTYKYDYFYDGSSNSYVFPSLDTNLIGLLIGDQLFCLNNGFIRHSKSGAIIDSVQVEPNSWVGLIFDSTNLYTIAGGQLNDIGVAVLSHKESKEFTKVEIDELASIDGRIIHFGNVISSFKITPQTISSIEVDARLRLGSMRAHTTSHLLNAALRDVLTCTHQKSCRVFPDLCALDFSVYGETLSVEDIATIEKNINDVIDRGVKVSRKQITLTELISLPKVTVIPGEVYPDDISLIDISGKDQVISREPCCGTHVLNTRHIESCTILSYKSHNHGVRSIKCVTGESSQAAVRNGKVISDKIKRLEESIKTNPQNTEDQTLKHQEIQLKTLKKLLLEDAKEIPFVVHKQSSLLISELSKNLKLQLRRVTKNKLSSELKELCNKDDKYSVHYINNDEIEINYFPPLSEISKPLLVILVASGQLRVQAYVPPQYCSPEFNAQSWLTPLLTRAQGKGLAVKGTDPNSIYVMSPVKITSNVEPLVRELVDIANTMAHEVFIKNE